MKIFHLCGFSASGLSRNDDDSMTPNAIQDLIFPVENWQILPERSELCWTTLTFLEFILQEDVQHLVPLQRCLRST